MRWDVVSAPLVTSGARLIDGSCGLIMESAALATEAEAGSRDLSGLVPGVVLALTRNTIDAVVRHLAVLGSGRAVVPLDPSMPVRELRDLVSRLAPAAAIGLVGTALTSAPPDGYRPAAMPRLGPAWVRVADPVAEPDPELALVLGTSGSTGLPKFVRLSGKAILHNALAVRDALGIKPTDVVATPLPLFYSYGLNVLHSHLVAGATIVLVEEGILSRAFLRAVDQHRVTSLSCVPHHFEMLRRIRWFPDQHPTLQAMTVSGGRLRDELAGDTHRRLAAKGGGLYVMYGQTEAGSRISVVPPEQLLDKLGSAGLPIPGVRIEIRTPDGAPAAAGQTGEVTCHSPSVMMGYAHSAADLAGKDELHGVLHTGDLGRLDPSGHLFLTGRVNRIGKVFGIRIDLDAVEACLGELGTVAAVACGDTVRVWAEHCSADPAALVTAVTGAFRVHPSGVDVRAVDELPRRANGKVDYAALGRVR